MAASVRSVFFTPPMAIARLGGSDTPVDAYVWQEDPSRHGGALTALVPTVSLRVEDDGSVTTRRPTELIFRDGPLLRPVAPFLELWAEWDDGSVGPLTSTALATQGGTLEQVTYTVEAANRKAERRTLDPSCGFSATVSFDHASFETVELLASSPGTLPLVKPEEPISLGHIRPLRPVADPSHPDAAVRDGLRLRFTPAKGLVYGPPSAGVGEGAPGVEEEVVREGNRILNEGTAWTTYSDGLGLPHPQPPDTYDGSNDPVSENRSWGVVDDTCDVLITATVALGEQSHACRARVFVGPPDYAPDKRPFISLLDDMLDRVAPDAEFNPRLAELEVADLLRRAFETISLDDVDAQRRRAVAETAAGASQLLGAAGSLGTSGNVRARLGFDTRRTLPPMANRDSMTDDDQGFRAADRNQVKTDVRFPFSDLAAEAHSALTSMPTLLALLADDAARIRRLLRPPYALVRESAPDAPQPPPGRRRPWDPDAFLHDMRMPPYMRDSDASPLSLSRRQYVQVMRLVDHLETAARAGVGAFEEAPPAPVDPEALFAAFLATDLTRDVPEAPLEPRP